MNSVPPHNMSPPQHSAELLEAPGFPSGEEVDLVSLFGVLWRGKWLFVGYALVVFPIAVYYAYGVATSYYRSSGWLALQVQDAPVVDIQSVVSGVSTEAEAINTEIDIIKSRELLLQLVDELNLTEDPEFNTRLRPEGLITRRKILGVISTYVPGFEFDDTPPTQDELRLSVAKALSDTIGVSAKPSTYLYSISATTTDPDKSAQIVNQLANIYIQDQVRVKFKATEFAVDWLAERVGELEIEVKNSEDAIKNLRAETELTSFEALEALNLRSKELRKRLAETQDSADQLAAQEQQTEALRSARDFAGLAAFLGDPVLANLAPRAVAGGAADQEPFLARLELLQTQSSAELRRVTTQLGLFRVAFDDLNAQIEEQNADLIELNQLTREAEASKVLYETFLTRLKETSVQIGLLQADSRVMSSAVAGEKVAPRRSLIMAGALFLSFCAAAATLFMRQFLFRGFRRSEDLEQATGYTVIGQIPLIPMRGRAKLTRYLRENPTSAAVEAIRNLRTSLLFSDVDNPPQVIMSTSSVPGEGKTTQSISLALNLAGLGKSVLLVEGDIRRRTMDNYFKKTAPGNLISTINEQHALEDAIAKDAIEGVDVLLGGSTKVNAADFFSSNRFQAFLQKARERYDYIVIDTPPVLVVPDARIIGRFVDKTIYSVKWNSTSPEQVIGGLRELRSVGISVAGLVFSLVDAKGMKRYGYGGKYGSYGAYGDYGRGYYET